MTTGTYSNKYKSKSFDWKWLLGWSAPLAVTIIGGMYLYTKTEIQANTNDKINNVILCHKIDSISKRGIEKDKRDNEQDIVIKDFKETMVDYAQRQEKMYLQVQDEQRLTRKILVKMDKNQGKATDLLEELKEKQEQNNNNN